MRGRLGGGGGRGRPGMRNTAGAAAMSLYAFRLQQLATDAVVLGVRVGSRREVSDGAGWAGRREMGWGRGVT